MTRLPAENGLERLESSFRGLKVLRTVSEFREACQGVRGGRDGGGGGRLGFVPTMGALHAGHRALFARARELSDQVAVSIFVNPTQFAAHEDLAAYPRHLEADLEVCRDEGVSLVFAPDKEQIYPPGDETRIRVGALALGLCGRSRPTHFEGVATVVAKLFNLTGPCVAVFGRKDFQQLRVVERLVKDLLLEIEVVGHPTVREPDGLAISSRNHYLDPRDRQRALRLSRGLSRAVRVFDTGERRADVLRNLVVSELTEQALAIDYVQLAHPETLEPIADRGLVPERVLLAGAVLVGSARLIDNVVLGEDSDPIRGKVP